MGMKSTVFLKILISLTLICIVSVLFACEKSETEKIDISYLSKQTKKTEFEEISYGDDVLVDTKEFISGCLIESLSKKTNLTQNQLKKINELVSDRIIPSFEESMIDEKCFLEIIDSLRENRDDLVSLISDLSGSEFSRNASFKLSFFYELLIKVIGFDKTSALLMNSISSFYQYNADECRRKYETYGESYSYQLKNEAEYLSKKKCLLEEIGKSNFDRLLRIGSVTLMIMNEDGENTPSDTYQVFKMIINHMESLSLTEDAWNLLIEWCRSIFARMDSIKAKAVSTVLNNRDLTMKTQDFVLLSVEILRELSDGEANELLLGKTGILFGHIDSRRAKKIEELLDGIEKVNLSNLIDDFLLRKDFDEYKSTMSVSEHISLKSDFLDADELNSYLNYKNPEFVFIMVN